MSTPAYDFSSPSTPATEPEIDDDTQDEYDSTPKPHAEAASDFSPRRRRRSTTDLSKATIRRVLAKADEIAAADESTVDLLSATLGTGKDPADLIAAIFSATKRDFAVLDDAKALLSKNKHEVAIEFLTLKSDQRRSMWAVLASFDLVPDSMPGVDAQAAMTVVEALDGDLFTITTQIESALALAAKTGR